MPPRRTTAKAAPKSVATLPDSWLYSDEFLKRAFAVWGHFMVAHFLILAGVAIIVLALGLTFGALFHFVR